MGNISVSKDKQEALRRKMENLGIFEKDIVEKFIRSRNARGRDIKR
jgi:hypothetical protein